jgi:RNA polymerase sigma-70 factor (ECF subfamily)
MWKLLLVIALNKVRAAGAFHRAAKRDVRQTKGGEAFQFAVESRSGPDEEALTVLRLVVEDLLAELPGSHRRMIELRIEGHEVAQIAEQVQRSKRSVERVIQEFCRHLNALIREEK